MYEWYELSTTKEQVGEHASLPPLRTQTNTHEHARGRSFSADARTSLHLPSGLTAYTAHAHKNTQSITD